METPQVIPDKFSKLVNLIVRADSKGSLQNAYGFLGPRGLGKDWILENIAQNLFHGKQIHHPDIVFLHATKETKIEDVRSFVQAFHSTPLVEKRKLGILLHIDALSRSTQNSLLKTLEEPPQASTIFTTASSISSILPTIQSRLVKLFVPSCTNDELRTFLKENAFDDSAVTDEMMFYAQGKPKVLLELITDTEKQQSLSEAVSNVNNVHRDPKTIYSITHDLDKKSPEEVTRQLRYWLLVTRKLLTKPKARTVFLLELARTCSKILTQKTNENPLRLLESTCITYVV